MRLDILERQYRLAGSKAVPVTVANAAVRRAGRRAAPTVQDGRHRRNRRPGRRRFRRAVPGERQIFSPGPEAAPRSRAMAAVAAADDGRCVHRVVSEPQAVPIAAAAQHNSACIACRRRRPSGHRMAYSHICSCRNNRSNNRPSTRRRGRAARRTAACSNLGTHAGSYSRRPRCDTCNQQEKSMRRRGNAVSCRSCSLNGLCQSESSHRFRCLERLCRPRWSIQEHQPDNQPRQSGE